MMKTGQELYQEHLTRLKKAINLEKTDRPPIALNGEAFLVQYAGGKLSDLVTDTVYGHELQLKGLLSLGDIDCVPEPAKYPLLKGLIALAKVKVPGRDFADNKIWQVEEINPMTVEDYDIIIEKGWNYYSSETIKKYLPDTLKDAEYFAKVTPAIMKKFTDAGIVPLRKGVASGEPFGALSSARGIEGFSKDLHRMPEKVLAAMDVMAVEAEERLRKQIRERRPLTVFTGGAREAGDFVSRKVFDKFAWAYKKRNLDIIVEEEEIGYLHLDNSWDRFLDYFTELPTGKFIFHPDSTTDIFKAGELLKGRMCFMGDVAPALLVLGDPDEVYAYSRKLIEEFSPKGFIMAAGCGVPSNAKPENVKAMLAAAFGK